MYAYHGIGQRCRASKLSSVSRNGAALGNPPNQGCDQPDCGKNHEYGQKQPSRNCSRPPVLNATQRVLPISLRLIVEATCAILTHERSLEQVTPPWRPTLLPAIYSASMIY